VEEEDLIDRGGSRSLKNGGFVGTNRNEMKQGIIRSVIVLFLFLMISSVTVLRF
jgi:hypothetical protein